MKKDMFEAHEERDAAVNSLRALVSQVEKSINTRACQVGLLRALNEARIVLSQLESQS